jgi:DNA-binding Xre family transcriptional regulator
MTQGIYAITHIPSGRKYIGQSRRMAGRWDDHRKALAKGRHWSPDMQEVFDADGMESFSFTVLEVVADASLLREREQAHMQRRYAETGSYGFNESESPEESARRFAYASHVLKEHWASGDFKPGTVAVPNLRTWREYKLLSRAALAQAAGVTEPAIEKLEMKRSVGARYATVQKLATALGITADDLLRRKPPAEQTSF